MICQYVPPPVVAGWPKFQPNNAKFQQKTKDHLPIPEISEPNNK
jgi:hypothetical protein